MINSTELSLLTLRIVYGTELIILGSLLFTALSHLKETPIYKIIKKLSFSILILGIVRIITAFWDLQFEGSTGLISLVFNDIIYAYLVYVFIKFVDVMKKTDIHSLNFNTLLDKMIKDINYTISKVEKK